MFKISREYRKKIRIIKQNFGKDQQINKHWEEYGEFLDALTTFYELDYDEIRLKHLKEEIADLIVVDLQLKLTKYALDKIKSNFEFISVAFKNKTIHHKAISEIKTDEIIKIIYFKIDRTLKRIASGYYNENIVVPFIWGGGRDN